MLNDIVEKGKEMYDSCIRETLKRCKNSHNIIFAQIDEYLKNLSDEQERLIQWHQDIVNNCRTDRSRVFQLLLERYEANDLYVYILS